MALDDDDDLAPIDTEVKVESTPEPSEPGQGKSVRESIVDAMREHGMDVSAEAKAKADKPPAKAKAGTQGKAAAAPDKAPAGGTIEKKPTTPEGQQTAAAPRGWADEAKTHWASLPPAVQAAIAKRETDSAAGVEQLKGKYADLDRVIGGAQPVFAKHGLTNVQGVERVLGWARAVDQNPVEAIKALAAVYKIPIQLSTQQGAPDPGAKQPDVPESLRPYVEKIGQLTQAVETIQQGTQRQQQESTTAALTEWAKTKPHFNAVRTAMSQMIAGAVQAQDASIFDASGRIDLDKLYDMAVYANPETRALAIAEANRARTEAARAAAAKARKAAVGVKGSPPPAKALNGAGDGKGKGKSVRQSIMESVESLRDN